jgi:pilus assembly protein TadC
MALDILWMNGSNDQEENNMLFLKAILYTFLGVVALCLFLGLVVGIIFLGMHWVGEYFGLVVMGLLLFFITVLGVYQYLKEDAGN